MRPFRQEVERLLEAGHTCGVPKTEGVCRGSSKCGGRCGRACGMKRRADERYRGAGDPARRALAQGQLWDPNAEGSRFVETMMTVVATLKQQQRPVLDYLTTACEAALCAESVPSLLPTPDALQQGMRPAA